MGEWNRSTRELQLENIRPELAAAIREHIEFFNLGPILDDHLICIETTSDKKKKGLFGGKGDKSTIGVYIVTPDWLVMSIQGDISQAFARSVQLMDAVAEDYANSINYQILPDTGISVTGIFTGEVGIMNGHQRVMNFIALGEEPAAAKFKEIVFQSIQNQKK